MDDNEIKNAFAGFKPPVCYNFKCYRNCEANHTCNNLGVYRSCFDDKITKCKTCGGFIKWDNESQKRICLNCKLELISSTATKK